MDVQERARHAQPRPSRPELLQVQHVVAVRQLALERFAKPRRVRQLAERPQRVPELPSKRMHRALQREREKAEPAGRRPGLETTPSLVDFRRRLVGHGEARDLVPVREQIAREQVEPPGRRIAERQRRRGEDEYRPH